MVALAAPGGGDSAAEKLRLLLLGARNAPSDLARWGGQIWQGMKAMPAQELAAEKAFLDGRDPATGKTVEQMSGWDRADQLAHFFLNNQTASIAPESAFAAGIKLRSGERALPIPRGLGAASIPSRTTTLDVGGKTLTFRVPKLAGADTQIVHVDPAAFDAAWQRDPNGYVGPGGQGGIGNRYADFAKYAASGEPIEAGEPVLSERGGAPWISFVNGRHRTAWTRDQNPASIPVAMTPGSIDIARKYGMLKNVDLGGPGEIKAMGAVGDAPMGIGHNQPPESIAEPPPAALAPPASSGRPGGPAIAGSRGRLGQIKIEDILHEMQLQRGDAGLPFAGKGKGAVTPPSHIVTLDDFNDAVDRYIKLAMLGQSARHWYDKSGDEILKRAGGDKETASAFGASLARTSPRTDVHSNTAHAIKAHNQAMVGDPIKAGSFPNAMGRDLSKVYNAGEFPTAEKIGPFFGGITERWDPEAFKHQYVNDIHNMRAGEYTNPGVGHNSQPKLYSGTPTIGQHNYMRVLADAALQELQRRGDTSWTPKQLQAAAWTGIKSQVEGTDPNVAGANFADALDTHSANLSFETAPGRTSGHVGYHDAPPWQQQLWDKMAQQILTLPDGRDRVAAHVGALVGETTYHPGAFGPDVNTSGSNVPMATGYAKGGQKAGMDDASRKLADTVQGVKSILFTQDAGAYHKAIAVKNPSFAASNMVDVDMGRPLSFDEAHDIHAKMMALTQGKPTFVPIGHPNGFAFMNYPDSGYTNGQLHQLAAKVLQQSPGLPDLSWGVTPAFSQYWENDWRSNHLGQDHLSRITATGSPGLQRAGEDALATLGPEVSALQDHFQQNFGWQFNKATRTWEDPAFLAARQGAPQVAIPTPPKPWAPGYQPQAPLSAHFGGAGPAPGSIPASAFPFAAAAPDSLKADGAIPGAGDAPTGVPPSGTTLRSGAPLPPLAPQQGANPVASSPAPLGFGTPPPGVLPNPNELHMTLTQPANQPPQQQPYPPLVPPQQ